MRAAKLHMMFIYAAVRLSMQRARHQRWSPATDDDRGGRRGSRWSTDGDVDYLQTSDNEDL